MIKKRQPANFIMFLRIALVLFSLLPASSPGNAQEQEGTTATITVNSHLDTSGNGGICTLRDAIIAANTNATAGGCAAGSPYPTMDTINITLSRQFCLINGCTIILSSPLPAVSEDVSIQGTGNWVPTISGNYAHRIFDLQAVVVNISNMYLIRGNAVGASTAGYGGAINTSSNGTTLAVTSVTFSENHAQSRGGAVQVSGGIVTIDKSTFTKNSVDYYGGAIGQFNGVLLLTNSTIANNTAYDGGGIEIQGNSDTRITNVTISSNIANGRGGGISRIGTGPTVSLNNVTITNNWADYDRNSSGEGGGIYRGGGTINLANSIIAGNIDLKDLAGGGSSHPDCSGTVTSFGYNLIGDGSGCSGPSNSLNGDKVGSSGAPLPAGLNPIANNGGPTSTHSLAPNSPALDAGNPAVPGGGSFAPCAASDQRNVARPQGAVCDMGAHEGFMAVLFLPLIPR